MLAGQVSRVVAVSAPLAIIADRLADDGSFWESLLVLGRDSTPGVINMITMQEDYYAIEMEGCIFTPEARERLAAARLQAAQMPYNWLSRNSLARIRMPPSGERSMRW